MCQSNSPVKVISLVCRKHPFSVCPFMKRWSDRKQKTWRKYEWNNVVFFLHVISVVRSLVRVFLHELKQVQRSTFTFILFPPLKKNNPSWSHLGVAVKTVLWKWWQGLDKLLFSVVFTIPWHSQSVVVVVGGAVFTLPPPPPTYASGPAGLRWKKEKEDGFGCGNGNDIGFSIGAPPGSAGFLMIL